MRKIFVETVCLIIILLFVYTGLSKFAEFSEFKAAVGKSPMLTSFSTFIVYFIPSLEIATGVLLAMPRWRLVGLYISYALMLMFTLYIYLMIYHSDYRGCTCGGIIQRMSWDDHLYFNAILTLLILVALLLEIKRVDSSSSNEKLILT